ncbi:MAG: carboxypeptidase-like regulatory domain-containing protein [Bacteroidota bacterium]
MKKIVLFFTFFAPFLTFSQTVKLEGIVKDKSGPLEMSNVIAFKKGTNLLQSYSITNAKGYYKLSLEANKEYTLKVSYLGYETKNVNVSLNSSEKQTRDIVMSESSESLNEVELTYEMPVKIVGDTIVYNSDSFTTGTEKKLEDILEKLPGVEIDDNGEVEVEGKKVQKILVEGKEFFDGDTKLATQNIPANAVDKIQVLKNYNEVSGMRGITNNEDNIAMNIKLKEGKTRFWFGEVNAGVGTSDEDLKYQGKPKLFYYSPEKSVNVLADFNNIGEPPFTRRDYFRFTGGLRGAMHGSGSSFNISSSDLGFTMAQNNRAQEIVSNFGAVNFSLTPKESLVLNGFSIVNDSDTDMFIQRNTVYNESGMVDNNETVSNQSNQLAMLKFSTTYTPNNDLHIDYDIFGKISKQTEMNDVTSTQRSADTYLEEQPVSLNQNLNVYYTLNDKNVFSSELQYIYQKDTPLFNSIAEEQPFEILPTIEQDFYDLLQNKEFSTSKFDGKVDYYYLLNNKSNLNFTLGTTLSSQNFESYLRQTLEDGSVVNFDEEILNNGIDFYFSDVFLAIHYKLVKGIFTFNPGVSIHKYKIEDEQLSTTDTDKLTKVLPDVYARLQFNSSQSLRFNYAITSQFSDVNKAAEGYMLTNYKSLTRGNRYLENSLNHRYSLSFFSFSLFSFTNINASITYTRKVDGIKNNTEIIGIDRISYPLNSEFADETFTGFFRYGKTYNKFKTNFRANINNSIFNNFVNDEWLESKTFTQSYQGSVATKFKNSPNFEVGYQLSLSKYAATGSTTNRPFANLEIPFLKSFIFTADYSYYNYRNDERTYENKYSFLNANLYYQQKDSKWEFKLSGSNLTDNKSINTDSYNEISNSNTTSLYYIQPRLWMFSVKYML